MRPDQNHPERSCRDSHRVVIAMDEPRQASTVNARPGEEGVFSLIYIPLHKNLASIFDVVLQCRTHLALRLLQAE